jgi:hypothetical protein
MPGRVQQNQNSIGRTVGEVRRIRRLAPNDLAPTRPARILPRNIQMPEIVRRHCHSALQRVVSSLVVVVDIRLETTVQPLPSLCLAKVRLACLMPLSGATELPARCPLINTAAVRKLLSFEQRSAMMALAPLTVQRMRARLWKMYSAHLAASGRKRYGRREHGR